MDVKVSLEYLFHYNCPACEKWWSVGNIPPSPESTVFCPHCGKELTVPYMVHLGDGGMQDIEKLELVERIKDAEER